jgi:aliphatic nitrilase
MAEGMLRVAAVQAGPVFLDRDRTVEKALRLIAEAGRNGARMIAFGECFLPGHPVWFHFLPVTHPRSIELSSTLVDNAVTVPGPEADAIAAAARDASAVVVLGFVERPDPRVAVVYDALLVAGPDGILGVRRKIAPAVGERVLFSPGGRESIRTFDTPWGPMSALAAGENSNPLLTAAMRESGARIHVASWPPHFNKPGLMGEVMTITGRAVAYQNTAWVIAAAGATTAEAIDLVTLTDAQRSLLEAIAADAVSAVWAPRGALHAGPLPGGEGILYADLDLGLGTWARLVNRHYDRPDLLHLEVGTDADAPGTTRTAADMGRPADPDVPIRQAIIDRFGAGLPPGDVDELVPYVRAVREASDRLAAMDLVDADPRRTTYADDPRPAP